MKTKLTLFSAFLALGFYGNAQKSFWSLSPEPLKAQKSSIWNQVSNLKLYQLDHQAFRNYLMQNVPAESLNAKPVPVSMPLPDGSMRIFYITESAVMEPELAAKFPEIKTYKGTDGLNYMRMCISPYGFQANILTTDGDIVIEATDKKNLSQFGVFYSKDINVGEPISMSCGTKDFSKISNPKKEDLKHELQSRTNATTLGVPLDLRTYRLALTCTGEWGGDPNFGGGMVATALAKMAAALTYVNAIYEKDVAIHLNMIANNDKLIYLDGNIDPYATPTLGGGLLGVNTQVINAKIGAGGYDIGHIITINCSDVGGVAHLACVCQSNKGDGVTCWNPNDIQNVAQRVTAHEMGHQFSAQHTFSNCNNSNQLAGTAYEPGGGSTIMSYAGGCLGDNIPGVASGTNYFHSNSLESIINYSRNHEGSTCPKVTATNNTIPVPQILIPSGLYIPIRTPFILRGSATDMENDTLTYNWEQYDAGSYGTNIGDVSLTDEGPLFKSVMPNKNPNRVVPEWNTVLNKGNFDVSEVLPTVSRGINFRLNVRDNHTGAGGTAWQQIKFNALDAAGPFTVTYPNYPQTDTLFVGFCNKITWDVANTDKSLVNCQKVNIFLMPNRTKPDILIPLVMNTENDGQELVDIPDTLVNQIHSRIIVEAADNIFFDATDADIRIKKPTSPKLNFGVSPNTIKVCVPDQRDISIKSCALNITGAVQLYIESGLPDKANYSFGKTSMDVNDQTTLHLDFSDVRSSGISHLIVAAITPSGDTLREDVEMDLVSTDYSDLKTIYPANGLSGLNQSIEFQWNASVNANSYTLEVATSPAFGNTTIFSISGLVVSSYKPNIIFNENTLYFWRVTPTNRCGLGSPTTPSPFHTVNKSCVETLYPGNVISKRVNQTGLMLTPIKDAGIISDVNIKSFMANANFVYDITLTMISPKGTRVKLFAQNCGNTGEFNCTFDDDGSNTLVNPSNGCPPIQNKAIKPLEPLSKFNGEDKKGDWNLEVVCDANLSGFADFNSYTLDICSQLIVNDPFLINNLVLQMNKGETKGIGQNLLLSQDNDNGPSELIYTIVVIPQKGDLLINGIVAVNGSKFSQKDIDDGKLSYHHKGQDQETDGFYFTVEDGTGGWFGSDFFKIQIGTVATKDAEDQLGLTVYPNPSNGLLIISSDKILDKLAELRIMNVQGQVMLIKSMGLQKADVLNVHELPDGIYMLEIRSGKYHAVNKIVIKK